ncbi:MAG: hypothetical protein R2734_08440 [Nocardioides sp.]
MLDIIGADETIRDVYHLPLTTADFDESLRVLSDQRLRIIPHIVLGLALRHDARRAAALEIVAAHDVSTLILVVLVPLVGTPMADLPPPPADEVADFFDLAG